VLRFLAVFLLLISCMFGQQIYPHLPSSGPSEEGPSLRVIARPTPLSIYAPTPESRSLEIYLRQLSVWDSWSLGPFGNWIPNYRGDFVGHFWVVLDFNTHYNPLPAHIQVPNLYNGYYTFDYDILLNEELHGATPIQPPTGLYWYNFWFSQTASGQVAKSRNLFPGSATSVAYDAFGGGYSNIPIARFVYPAVFQGSWVQIHVIGNMWHEVDGQGWIYLNTMRLL